MTTFFSGDHIAETLLPAIKDVLMTPRLFFEQMQTATGYKGSLLLLGLIFLIPALVISLPMGIFGVFFVLFMLSLALVCTWLWAGYLAWAVSTFTEAELSATAAFQICAYSAIPLLFSWLPVANIISSLWNMYLTWQGLVSHARVGRGAALLILLVPMLIFMLSLFLLFWLLFSVLGDTNLSTERLPSMGFF